MGVGVGPPGGKKQYGDEGRASGGRQGLGPTKGTKNNMPTKGARAQGPPGGKKKQYADEGRQGLGPTRGKKQFADEGRQGLGPTTGKKNNMPTKGVRV